MINKHKSICILLLIFMIIFVLILAVACVFKKDPAEIDNAEKIVEKLPNGNSKENEKEQTKGEVGNQQGYIPPEESSYLGRFLSPNEINSLILWSWYSKEEEKHKLDLVIWDDNTRSNQKVYTIDLDVDEKRDNTVVPIWVNDYKVLLEGKFLLDFEEVEGKDILPQDMKKLKMYKLNKDKDLLALSGITDDSLGIWIIDVKSNIKHDVYFLKKKNIGEVNDYKIAWDSNDNLYFDTLLENRPSIYKYNLEEEKFDMILTNARLIDIDIDKNELKYFNYIDGNTYNFDVEKYVNNLVYTDMMEAAESYMQKIGFIVGEEPGRITLVKDRVFNNTAVIMYGFWSSEIVGEIILERKDGKWGVAFDRQRHYLPYYKGFQEAMSFLEKEEGFIFEDTPGKHVIGSPYWDDKTIVFLVGEYAKPWSWEYHLTKEYDRWIIIEKQELTGSVAKWWQPNSASKVVYGFLESIKEEDYAKAYEMVYFDRVTLTVEEFKENIIFIKKDVKLIDFDLGEVRINEETATATVQVWIIVEKNQQELMLYDRLICLQEDDSWKLIWSIDLFFDYLEDVIDAKI